MESAEAIREAVAEAAEIIRQYPREGMAYTGAGISVESGIPPFRGADGLWNKVDPSFIELEHFYADPRGCWAKIRELFYDHWGQAEPNDAHYRMAEMFHKGYLKGIVTQNIDCLHQRSGIPVEKIYEFHGTLDQLVCTRCGAYYKAEKKLIEPARPSCPKCGALLKPDFVFFSEGIPEDAFQKSFQLAKKVRWCLVVGTTGEVMPACQVPITAKHNGAKIIEINPCPSEFTHSITDVYIPARATVAMNALYKELIAALA